MPYGFPDTELQLRKKLLRRMRQFNKVVSERSDSPVVYAKIDVDEELSEIPYDWKYWNIDAWLSFIVALQERLTAVQPQLCDYEGPHVARALEQLAKMRDEIDVARMLGGMNLRDP